ncbi:SCP2 sterol-binding domain-containing protein [Halorientalis salina]|uniref:SCP2 sterol-binding domain-containing protein n=1 Tax=Halorientalis salina TaxID=2932266 RepID=UPI0010ACAC57|nr:SCP2 sterol-binding domain-containing protein [Halorientalis salina]
MTEELVDRIEASLEKDEAQLKTDLPGLLEDIDGRERQLIADNPEVFSRVVGRMEAIDIEGFYADEPEAADRFQDLLWTGVNLLVEDTPAIREQITTDITANFEADDCPMEGHLQVDAAEETVTGGAGLAEEADLTLSGPADTLTALITGGTDPIQGFMTQEYELDGSVQKGTQLASVMGEITESVPNSHAAD